MRRLWMTLNMGLLLGLALPDVTRAQTVEKADLTEQPTLYVVGYAHLDTEWRWEYPQVIDEYIRKTMEDNFKLFEQYPHYTFNFSGANRYRFMKEYFPSDFAKVKKYVDEGRWFPAGSSMEEGDVNTPSAEAIIRQILYGNNWFRNEFGKASAEYMLPDCFGFPSSLPTILAHSGVKGFSTQKLVWGSSAMGEAFSRWRGHRKEHRSTWSLGRSRWGRRSRRRNPGSYNGNIDTDLSTPLAPHPADSALVELEKKIVELQEKLQLAKQSGKLGDRKDIQELGSLRRERSDLVKSQEDRDLQRFQGDWAARVELNGKISGLFTDYHYYGTGDTGGAPREESVKRLEAIVTKGTVSLPAEGQIAPRGPSQQESPAVKVGDGPVHVISATAEQMF